MRFILFIIILVYSPYCLAQQGCETLVTASLQRLPSVLVKNDFNQLQTIINTLKGGCDKNELALRLEITQQLVLQQNTDLSIKAYLDGRYDDILVQRFDDAASKKANEQYRRNPEKYQYFPLNHKVDSLLKLKAQALLSSESYTLNPRETAIVYLFADYIDNFYDELDKTPKKRPIIDKIKEADKMKDAPTIGVHAGIFSPLQRNTAYGVAPAFGLSLMGPFSNLFIPELSYKFRVHEAAPFDMKYKGEIREVSPRSSHFISLGIGYKVYDSGKIIVLPKLNSGLGFIWTGLSESYYQEDEYGNEERNTSYKNINTWQNSIGVASMLHIKRKTYIGLETNYHFIPYSWDSRLKSNIPSHYVSLDLFIRF